LDVLASPERLGQEIQLYQEKQRGMLSSVFSAFAFLPLDKVFTPEEFTAFRKRLHDDTSLTGNVSEKKEFSLVKEWFEHPQHSNVELLQIPGFFSINPDFKPKEGSHYNTIMVGNLQPLSRGSVHISSADPLAAPDIDPAYLKNPLDLDVLVGAIKFCRRLMKTPPYSAGGGIACDPPAEMTTDDEIREWARAKVEPFYHPVATASMLPRGGGGVVDSTLKVYGTKNLRVVDASIIPLQLSAHIQATVYAIAEKAADIIKAERV